MQAERKGPWPPSHVDCMGRGWRNEKLDRILADPQVIRLVQQADAVGRGVAGMFDADRVRLWAKGHGRSADGIALLLVLRRRLLQREGAIR